MMIAACIVGLLAIFGAVYAHVAGWDAIHDETATDEAWVEGRRKVRRHHQ